jgi:hypothetical protein
MTLLKSFVALGVVAALLAPPPACAGVDISSTNVFMQVGRDGKLWFRLANTSADAYCQQGWAGLNLYVPTNHPEPVWGRAGQHGL